MELNKNSQTQKKVVDIKIDKLIGVMNIHTGGHVDSSMSFKNIETKIASIIRDTESKINPEIKESV